MSKDTILAALPKLSLADLAIVHAVASQLMGAAGALSEPGATTPQQTVFDALTATLGTAAHYQTWRVTTAGKKFDKDVPTLLTWLAQHFKGWDENRIKEQAFLRMLFGLVIANAGTRDYQLTLAQAAVSLGTMPFLFEEAFPGYLKSGLGFLILKKCQ
jgi:hypothetical protein